MAPLEAPEKVAGTWLRIIIGILVLCSYSVGLGYDIERISDHDRRISDMETSLKNTVQKDDLQEIKQRLDKIDDKLDRLNSRQSAIRTFDDRKQR